MLPLLTWDAHVLPTGGSTFYVFACLCVYVFCWARSSITGSDPVVITYCVAHTFWFNTTCLIRLNYSLWLCLVASCRVGNLRSSLSSPSLSTRVLCLYAKRGPLHPFSISWFKTLVVLPRFYASARNSATPSLEPTPLDRNLKLLPDSGPACNEKQLWQIYLTITWPDIRYPFGWSNNSCSGQTSSTFSTHIN